MTYTTEQAVQAAVERAARDREGSFAVIRDGADILMQDAAAARPLGSQLACIAQFWKERDDGIVEVQIRWSGALSEFQTVDCFWATPGTGEACGAANDCARPKGHKGKHSSRSGREW